MRAWVKIKNDQGQEREIAVECFESIPAGVDPTSAITVPSARDRDCLFAIPVSINQEDRSVHD